MDSAFEVCSLFGSFEILELSAKFSVLGQLFSFVLLQDRIIFLASHGLLPWVPLGAYLCLSG